MTPDQMEQCGQILTHFGPKAQTDKTLEELFELHTAIRQQEPANVIEKMAGLEILFEQMKQMFGCHEEVQKVVADKLARTRSRVVIGFYNEAVEGEEGCNVQK